MKNKILVGIFALVSSFGVNATPLEKFKLLPNVDTSKTQLINIANRGDSEYAYKFEYADNRAVIVVKPKGVASFGLVDGMIVANDSNVVQCHTEKAVKGVINAKVSMYTPPKGSLGQLCTEASTTDFTQPVGVSVTTIDVEDGSRTDVQLTEVPINGKSESLFTTFVTDAGLAPSAVVDVSVAGVGLLEHRTKLAFTVYTENGQLLITREYNIVDGRIRVDMIDEFGELLQRNGVKNAGLNIKLVSSIPQRPIPLMFVTVTDSMLNGDVDGMRANYTAVKTVTNF